MMDYTHEYAPILQRAINAYEGLIKLYEEDAQSNVYFNNCLGEARTKRDGLRERLVNPGFLADVFTGNYYQSIDRFLESHRGEYGFDMPSPNPAKASLANQYLEELNNVIEEIIRVKRVQQNTTQQ